MLKSIKTRLTRLTVDLETSLVLERMDSLTEPLAFEHWITDYYTDRLIKDIHNNRRDNWLIIREVAKEIRRRNGEAAWQRYYDAVEPVRLAVNTIARRHGK